MLPTGEKVQLNYREPGKEKPRRSYEKVPEDLKCDICEKSFKTNKSFSKHRMEIHEKPMSKCRKCDQDVKTTQRFAHEKRCPMENWSDEFTKRWEEASSR